MNRNGLRFVGAIGLTMCVFAGIEQPCSFAADYKAGLASKTITPTEPLWMAGYADRKKPAEGKLQDLYLKALALEDQSGQRLVLLTSDLLGLPRALSEAVGEEVHRRTGLPRARLLLTSSHTHCGPVVRSLLSDMYDLTAEQLQQVDTYTNNLRAWMVDTIIASLQDLKPASLAIGKNTARFAVNRRRPTSSGIAGGANPAGPVDHDVPVLRVMAADGNLRAMVFGYACHNTTLQFYQWCGDYAGFAQEYLQQKHPGALALFWMGCGGDANPLPRSTVAFCQQHGRELADAVEALAGPMAPVRGPFAARYGEISLPFDTLPAREKLDGELLSKNVALRHRAARLIKHLDNGGKIAGRYDYYPIQVWRLGDQLLWIALGGEVVVDYSLRLKRELAGSRTVWVTAYANDVMAYIPSLRVLKEGGYEGDTSMIYYGMPAKWGPPIEERIVAKVHALVKSALTAP